MSRRRGRRVAVVAVVVVALAWLAGCAWLLFGAQRDMRAGESQLRSVRDQATITALVAPGTRARLGTAHDRFASAEGQTSSPVLAPLRILPVVGSNVRAADRLARAGAVGSADAQRSLAQLARITERPQHTGEARLTTLTDLATLADSTAADLRALDVGSSRGLVGPLGDAVATVGGHRDAAASGAGELAATARALRTVLAGPQPYLLIGANNAEMRNGTGMFLSAATLRFDRGHLVLGSVRPTATLFRPPGSVPVDGDLEANWGWLDPGSDLRNLATSADFPQSAAVAVRNWAAVPGGTSVAGVVVIDVDGLRSLLRVVGPVDVDGVRYSADNVRGHLLRDQYTRFGGNRDARRDELGSVARAVFARIEAGRWDTARLATELTDAVAGRHLMVWSKQAQVEQAWSKVGADGHLTDHSIAVGLVNRGANKLDSWVDTTVALDAAPPRSGRRRITITCTVRNRAPSAGPAYVVGPNIAGMAEGEYRALLVANLPAGATDVRMTGATRFLAGGDGPTVVVGGRLTVARGSTATITITASLPDDVVTVTLEPSARIPRVRWEVAGRELPRDRRQDVDLGR